MKDHSVVLLKFEGVKIKVPLSKLSVQDLEYVDSIFGTQFEDHTDSDETEAEEDGSDVSAQLHKAVLARVPRYCFAEDKYWFVVEVLLGNGQTWQLARYYEDFYDLQIALLTEFPHEAGNTGTQKRTLPYMPGPVTYATDRISEGRVHNLNAYLRNLLIQPSYISECKLVKQFFAPRDGDEEIDAIDWDGSDSEAE